MSNTYSIIIYNLYHQSPNVYMIEDKYIDEHQDLKIALKNMNGRCINADDFDAEEEKIVYTILEYFYGEYMHNESNKLKIEKAFSEIESFRLAENNLLIYKDKKISNIYRFFAYAP